MKAIRILTKMNDEEDELRDLSAEDRYEKRQKKVAPVAFHRKNSLFSFSKKGADATITIMSLIETAKANQAIPYYYLKYLLEKMSKGIYYNHSYAIDDMMPWSAAYHQYEQDERRKPLLSGAPLGNEKPRTPRKKDKVKRTA
ncbi:MAG: transposase domain-containing protein [Butyrivibrio sp.]|nr:transposase domain-containing protein [Butyrivibrio sp.]